MVLCKKFQLNKLKTNKNISIKHFLLTSVKVFKFDSHYVTYNTTSREASKLKSSSNSSFSLLQHLLKCYLKNSTSPSTNSRSLIKFNDLIVAKIKTTFGSRNSHDFTNKSRIYLANLKGILDRFRQRLQVRLELVGMNGPINRFFLSAAALFSWDEHKITNDDMKAEVNEILSMFTMEKKDGESEANEKIHIDLDKSRLYQDNEWKLIYDKPDLIIWRREIVLSENDLKNHAGHSHGGSANYDIYEYKVLGRLTDVTPIEFYKTQVDLECRKEWDYLIIHLDLVDKHPETHTELIRWIMRFPYPLYPREYVFVRRYCRDPEEGLLVLVSKAIPECNIEIEPIKTNDEHKLDHGPGVLDQQHKQKNGNQHEKHAQNQETIKHHEQHNPHQKTAASKQQHPHQTEAAHKNDHQNKTPSTQQHQQHQQPIKHHTNHHYVRVTKFKSNLIIMPHTDFDKPGLNYVMQYYDINKAKIPKIAYKWMATSGLPDFCEKMHKAALRLSERYRRENVNQLDLARGLEAVCLRQRSPCGPAQTPTPPSSSESNCNSSTTSSSQVEQEKQENTKPYSIILENLNKLYYSKSCLLEETSKEFFKHNEPHPVFFH